MARLEARGIARHFVTLHVGAGTFLPVKADDVADHRMHAEWGEIAAGDRRGPQRDAPARRAHRRGRHDLAAPAGKRRDGGRRRSQPSRARPTIFITPGYRFRTADMLMTNFHLPRSTLLMLVAAFAGHDRMRRAYAHAIASGYRFYSYGDAGLLFRDEARR